MSHKPSWESIFASKDYGLISFFREEATAIKTINPHLNVFEVVKRLKEQLLSTPRWDEYIQWVRDNYPHGNLLTPFLKTTLSPTEDRQTRESIAARDLARQLIYAVGKNDTQAIKDWPGDPNMYITDPSLDRLYIPDGEPDRDRKSWTPL